MADASNNMLKPQAHCPRSFSLEKPSGGEKKELAGQDGAASRCFFSEEAAPRADQKNSLDGKNKLFVLHISVDSAVTEQQGGEKPTPTTKQLKYLFTALSLQ